MHIVFRLLEGDDYLSLKVADLKCIAASQPKSFLSEYIFAKEALDIVDQHLPVLVELYEFIHRELSYRITKDLAKDLTIQEMLEKLKSGKLKSHFSQEDIKHLKKMVHIYCGKVVVRWLV
jgi:hypothetical protein